MTLETACAVANQLVRKHAIEASVEYPCVICLKSPQTGTAFLWGDANETLDADVYEIPIEEGIPTRSIRTEIPSSSNDVELIVATIIDHYREDIGAKCYPFPERT